MIMLSIARDPPPTSRSAPSICRLFTTLAYRSPVPPTLFLPILPHASPADPVRSFFRKQFPTSLLTVYLPVEINLFARQRQVAEGLLYECKKRCYKADSLCRTLCPEQSAFLRLYNKIPYTRRSSER